MDERARQTDCAPRAPGEELEQAVATLRAMAAPDDPVTITSFAPFAVAQLLDAIGDALADGVVLPERISRRALEIARHVQSHRPTEQ